MFETLKASRPRFTPSVNWSGALTLKLREVALLIRTEDLIQSRIRLSVVAQNWKDLRVRARPVIALRSSDGGRGDVGKPGERTSVDSRILNGAVPLISPYFFLNM